MIIWSGFGFLVPVCWLLVAVISTKTGFILGVSENIGAAIVLYITAALVLILSYFLDKHAKKKSAILINPATEQKVLLIRKDSLFFIPVKYWPIICAVIATSIFFFT